MALFLLLAFVVACSAEHNVSAETTFYGARDNCPPGADIAYPVIHKQAGGVGTYTDPITFAGDKSCFKPGTRLYIPHFQKYFTSNICILWLP
jgi:3D (Asp-Asp-Asp) domain-containing protein